MDALQKAYAPQATGDESALDTNSSYGRILELIAGQARIVDFGCGPGNLARFLTERGCTVVGVEVNPESAGIAREYCEDVIVADLDAGSLLELFPTDRFDVAIFADILEHLRDPWRLLSETHQILRAGGFVIASIPNIAHGAVRLSMLKGEFDYQPLGIMDDTHLRFFTHKTVDELFERCGFAIEDTRRTYVPIFGDSDLVPSVRKADFSPEVIAKIESDPEAETLQFIVKAVLASSSHDYVVALKRRNTQLEKRLHDAQDEFQKKLLAHGSDERDSLLAEHAALRNEIERVTERYQSAIHQIEVRDSALAALRLETALLQQREARFVVKNRDTQALLDASQIRVRELANELETMTKRSAQTREELGELRRQLSMQLRAQEQQIADGRQHLTEMHERAKQLEAELGKANDRATHSESLVHEMRNSRFWRLRNAWFRVKRWFGVESDIA